MAALIWLTIQAGRQALFWETSSLAFKLLAWLHLLLAVISFLLVSPFLAGLSFLTATTAFAVLLGSAPVSDTPRWSFPALALFLIPPPLRLDEHMHQLLAGLATRLSEGWLDAMQVLHVVEGAVVVTPEKRFFVDDACSGANSMLVAVCVALILCSLKGRTWMHSVCMFLTAGMISVTTNVFRICFVIGSVHFWGVEMDHGWAHDALGMFIFMVDLLLVWSADHGWHFILNHRPGMDAPTIEDACRPRNVAQARQGFLSMTVALMGVVSLLGPIVVTHSLPTNVTAEHDALVKFTLPQELSGWLREGDKPLEDSLIGKLGVRNQVWLYRKGALQAYVAVNFPFLGFHDTRLCYSGQGWQFQQQVDSALPGEPENTVRFLEMQQPAEMMQAHLWLSVLDEHGLARGFASENPLDRMTGRLLSRWTNPAPVTTTYVLQVLNVEPGATRQTQHEFTELLAGARARLAEVISNGQLQNGKESE